MIWLLWLAALQRRIPQPPQPPPRPRSILDKYAALPPGPCGTRLWRSGAREYPLLPHQIDNARWYAMTEHTGDDPLTLSDLLQELEAQQ